MADMISRLKLESGEFDSRIARATKGLLTMEKECRAVGGTLAILEKDQLEFVKGLGQMETVSQNAKGKIAELTSAFTELSVQYNRLTDEEKSGDFGTALAASLDQLKIRIQDSKAELSGVEAQLSGVTDTSANAGNAMTSVFEGFAQKLGVPMNALKQLSSQGFAGVAKSAASAGKAIMTGLGPIGAVVAAIVLAVKQLVEAFKRNEDAMTAVQKIAAPFKAVWQSIQRLFDDIVRVFVDVYNNLEKAAGGFDGFKMALAPLAAVIAAIRAQFAIVGTILTDLAKGVAFVSSKVREAMSGSKVGSFFQGITDTAQGFFNTFTGWVEKIANSTIGKKLGLDSLYTQLKEIVNAQDELTASNKRITDSENELNKLRRENIVANARDEQQIAKLREQASEKDKYNASERVKMLEQAAALEERIMQRNVDEKQRELDLIKLKNSLTQSGTEDLNAQANAEAAVIQSKTEFYNKERALQRQLQSSRNEAAGEGTEGGGTIESESPVEGSIAAQEKIIQELTEKWKNATGTVRDEYKAELEAAKKVLDEMVGKDEPPDVKDARAMWKEYEEKLADVKARLEEFKAMVQDQGLTDAQRSWAEEMAKSYQEQLDKMTNATEEAADEISDSLEEIPTKFEMIQEALDRMGTGVGAISTIGNAFNDLKGIGEDLSEAFSGNMDAWDAMMTVFNSGIGVLQTVMGVMEAINTLQQLSNALSDAKVAKQAAETTAVVAGKGAEAAAESAEATASGAATSANTAEAAAGAGKAMAGIPIVGPVLAIAAIAAVLAAILAATSKAKSAGSFATGGIVPGNNYNDGLIANVSSGELILNRAQQGAIASQLQGSAQQTVVVQGRISGKDILLSANNTNRAAGGSRGYYTKVH